MSSQPPKRRKLNQNNNNNNHQQVTKAATSVNHLKKRVRDLERLLKQNKNLTADARVENERALDRYQNDLKNATKTKKEQAIAKKYHMVRFFERRKAMRKVSKAQRELRAHDERPEELQQKVRGAEAELNYTLFYPKGEKYISLYKDPGGKTAEKRESIKQDIARRMENGNLGVRTYDDEEAAHDKRGGGGQHTKEKKKDGEEDKKSKNKKRKANEEPAQNDANLEDDDFFE